MNTLFRDIRYSVRRNLRSPGFALVAILSIGLGVGANTAIFTLVNRLLLSAPPYGEIDRLVQVYPSDDGKVGLNALSYPEVKDIREATTEIFEGIATVSVSPAMENSSGNTQPMMAEVVSGNYFEILGVEPLAGRLFTAEDDLQLDAHPVIVISERFWKSRFGRSADTVGKTLRLSSREYTIIGIAPEIPSLLPGFPPELYAPSMMVNAVQNSAIDIHRERGSHSQFARARLKPGVTLPQVQGVLDRVAGEVVRNNRDSYAESWGLTAIPTRDIAIHPIFDRILFPAAGVLMAIVGLVLLIACMNLASFLLARATDRKKEVAIRLAMGAKRMTLIRQLLTEAVMLALLGGTLGFLLGGFLLKLVSQVKLPLPMPFDLDMSPDYRVLLFTLSASLLAGLVFGLAPALQSTRPDLAPTLKNESVVGRGPRRLTLRNGLVVAQVAVSFLLLIGSGLFLRSLQEAQRIDPGFGREPTAIVWMDIDAHTEPARILSFYRELSRQVGAEPGTLSVALVDNLALGGVSFNSVRVNFPGIEPPPGSTSYVIDRVRVGPGYFETAGVTLLSGRDFRWEDDSSQPDRVIVNQELVDRIWPGQDALGRTLTDSGKRTYEVIGVAANTNVRQIGESPIPYLYFPFSQRPQTTMQILARTVRDPKQVAQEISRLAIGLDPQAMIIDTKSMQEHLSFMLFPFRVAGLMLSIFGGLTILLASIGLYGIVNYSISGRTREVGLRMSLGATPGRVIQLVMREGMLLVVAGMGLGALLAAILSPALDSLLFRIDGYDLTAYIGVAVLLAAVGILACYLPARRASRIDPMLAMRCER